MYILAPSLSGLDVVGTRENRPPAREGASEVLNLRVAQMSKQLSSRTSHFLYEASKKQDSNEKRRAMISHRYDLYIIQQSSLGLKSRTGLLLLSTFLASRSARESQPGGARSMPGPGQHTAREHILYMAEYAKAFGGVSIESMQQALMMMTLMMADYRQHLTDRKWDWQKKHQLRICLDHQTNTNIFPASTA